MSDQIYSSFSIGSVFNKTFDTIKNNFTAYIILTVIYSTFSFVSELLIFQGIENTLDSVLFSQRFRGNFGSMYFLSICISLISYAFFGALITDATLKGLHNQSVELGIHLSKAFSILLPMVGLYFFYFTYMIFGFIILIIPGIIIMLTYCVCTAVKLSENKSVFKSMERSKELTKGHRWSILVIILIPYILLVILPLSISDLLILNNSRNLAELSDGPSQFFSMLLDAIYVIFNFVLFTVVYNELVIEKEGGKTESVSEVFS